ncbi:hypothetical protein TNIN_121831 [Trichonephila inaurata madagascariensis]|uniref:Uncharacterized protein n=1 Tax=Trichonephila inaurata madagascariensis TaxID=2747483 RepID=A0A8X6WQK7_9ARAC|nr:hypothetical protein TNIN_121831 [Trichonephila inaurata madagascariensis]
MSASTRGALSGGESGASSYSQHYCLKRIVIYVVNSAFDLRSMSIYLPGDEFNISNKIIPLLQSPCTPFVSLKNIKKSGILISAHFPPMFLKD